MTEETTYTTGELAEACGTSVRTVQYYDQKGLLAPSGYSSGGRRLYTEDDASRLRFILLLKSLGLKLSQIKGILESPNREAILDALLEERRGQLEETLARDAATLKSIELMQHDLRLFGRITTLSKTAMDEKMRDKRARNRCWAMMIVVGILMDVAWIGTLVYGIVSGVWWPFPIALVFVAIAGMWMVIHYDAHVTYLCPACKAEFRSKLWPFFIAGHTLHTRKLTCPCCGTKDWCIEHYYADAVPVARGACMPGTCHCNVKDDRG
ncbi:MAG: MerR family transcriptional regulator [Coriobacteriales bacterium]